MNLKSNSFKAARLCPSYPVLALFILVVLLAWAGLFPLKALSGTLEIQKTRQEKPASHKKIKTYSRFTAEELKMFGVVMPPKKAFVQDTYRGIKFLATSSSIYTKTQLALLKSFIDRLPAALLRPGPSAIITYKRGEVRFPLGASPISLALASGPYVFFDTSAFKTGGAFSAGSIEGVYRAFVHELVHVKQFHMAVATIDIKKAIKAFRDKRIQALWNQAVLKTPFVRSFADVTGWKIKERYGYISARLLNMRQEKTSFYGKKSILEDQAETISFVVVGDTSKLSKKRVAWALKQLGFSDLKEALADTFPYSSMYKLVNLMGAGVTKFDKRKRGAFRKRYPLTDLEHFVGKRSFSFDPIVNYLESEFSKRGWRRLSSRSVVLKHGVKKHIMSYSGKWRDLYLEVITYDYAKGYTLKPTGTIITVLSGYKL